MLKGRLSFKGLDHADMDTLVDGVGAANRKSSQFSCNGSRQIHGKETHNLWKLGFADSLTALIPVFSNSLYYFNVYLANVRFLSTLY